MRFVMVGSVAFAVLPVLNLLLAVRSGAAVVGFSDWVAGYEFVAYGGAATFWLLGYAAVAAPELGRGLPAARRWQYRVALLGMVLFAGSLLVSGAQAGLIWLGSANSNAFANAGDGFRNTVQGLEGLYVVRLVGYAIYALAILWFAAGIAGRAKAQKARSSDAAVVPVDLDPDLALARPVGFGKLAAAVIALFGSAVVILLVTPIFEGELSEPTLLADEARTYVGDSPAAEGREIYVAEGCSACHTQAVRPIVTDVGLGAVSVGGDYVHEVPALIGSQRIGPDLMHVAGRSVDVVAADLAGVDGDPADFEDEARTRVAEFVRSHLTDPRAARPWSIMPSYDYLTADQMTALVAYVVGLE
jgi:cbb3-type cytochrome oxidase cytochrome c subunit